MNTSAFETIASWVAALAATGTLFWSVYTQNKIQKKDVKRATIEAFNLLQSEVLDKLASVDKANAEAIVERRETNEACRKAYNDYKVSGHPTAMGYSMIGLAMERLFSKCVTDNLEYFKFSTVG